MKRLPKVSPRVTAALRIAFIAVAVGLLVYALVSQWGSIHRALDRMGPLAVIGSLAAAMLGLFFSALCFRSLLTELGNRLPLPATLRVFFLAQVGKYLPGSVWPLLAQVELGRDLGVPRQRSATAGVLFLGLNPLTGLIVAAATLPLVSPDAARHYLWALAVVPIGLAVLHPRVLNPALRQAFRLIRRPPLERPLRAAGTGPGRGLAVRHVALLRAVRARSGRPARDPRRRGVPRLDRCLRVGVVGRLSRRHRAGRARRPGRRTGVDPVAGDVGRLGHRRRRRVTGGADGRRRPVGTRRRRSARQGEAAPRDGRHSDTGTATPGTATPGTATPGTATDPDTPPRA